jgi:hypothetical protein
VALLSHNTRFFVFHVVRICYTKNNPSETLLFFSKYFVAFIYIYLFTTYFIYIWHTSRTRCLFYFIYAIYRAYSMFDVRIIPLVVLSEAHAWVRRQRVYNYRSMPPVKHATLQYKQLEYVIRSTSCAIHTLHCIDFYQVKIHPTASLLPSQSTLSGASERKPPPYWAQKSCGGLIHERMPQPISQQALVC